MSCDTSLLLHVKQGSSLSFKYMAVVAGIQKKNDRSLHGLPWDAKKEPARGNTFFGPSLCLASNILCFGIRICRLKCDMMSQEATTTLDDEKRWVAVAAKKDGVECRSVTIPGLGSFDAALFPVEIVAVVMKQENLFRSVTGHVARESRMSPGVPLQR